MKKEYMKPKFEVVVLKVNNHLLVGSTISNESVDVYEEEYQEGSMDDL